MSLCSKKISTEYDMFSLFKTLYEVQITNLTVFPPSFSSFLQIVWK